MLFYNFCIILITTRQNTHWISSQLSFFFFLNYLVTSHRLNNDVCYIPGDWHVNVTREESLLFCNVDIWEYNSLITCYICVWCAVALHWVSMYYLIDERFYSRNSYIHLVVSIKLKLRWTIEFARNLRCWIQCCIIVDLSIAKLFEIFDFRLTKHRMWLSKMLLTALHLTKSKSFNVKQL